MSTILGIFIFVADVYPTNVRLCETLLKMSLRRLGGKILQTLLNDVLKMSWKIRNCYAEHGFKTSSRYFVKQEMFAGCSMALILEPRKCLSTV